jgi:hypothetical protein
VLTTGANVADISKAIDLLGAVPPIAGRRGRPPERFPVLLADKGYDSRAFRQACRDRGTEPVIPHRGTHGIKGPLAASLRRRADLRPATPVSADSPSAGNDASTSTKPSSASAAPLPACALVVESAVVFVLGGL